MLVYVSYTHDDRESVPPLVESLSAAGIEVLADTYGIRGGQNWRMSVKQLIEAADVVLAIMSNAASYSEWITYELALARYNRKRIIPLLVEKIDAAPWYLADLQFLDFTGDVASATDALVRSLEQTGASEPSGEAPFPQGKIEEELRKAKQKPSPDRVFIAYAREHHACAKKLADLLHRLGKEYFYDEHIRAGARWRQTIQKALDDATHIIVLWTPEAAASDEVDREISYALGEKISVIPLLSPDTPKLPYHLYGLHYIILKEDLNEIQDELLKAFEHRVPDEGIWQ